MMKKLFFLAFSLITVLFSTKAQNGVDVEAIISPQRNFNYDTSALVDITILIQNDGGQLILSDDTLIIKLDILNSIPSEGEFYDFKIPADTILNPGGLLELTLIEDYQFDTSDYYTVRASISGTTQYPINLTKNAQANVDFVVGSQELSKPEIKRVFYQNGSLSFQSNLNSSARIEVFDLSGKKIFSQEQSIQQQNFISFKAPANGFYFLRLSPKFGLSKTTKFVVH
ncbi:MAG: T9SS type A sorting domain-containing protein [Vicingaceae bacterium]